MNLLLVVDRALVGVIRRLEHLHRQVGRWAARSDDQRQFIIELERLEDWVVVVRDSDHDQNRIHDATNLILDFRRAKAKAHTLGFPRHAARTVRARIKAATTTILVEVFEIDSDSVKDVAEARPWRGFDVDEMRTTMHFPNEYKTQERP